MPVWINNVLFQFYPIELHRRCSFPTFLLELACAVWHLNVEWLEDRCYIGIWLNPLSLGRQDLRICNDPKTYWFYTSTVLFLVFSTTSTVVWTIKCLCPPQQTESTVWHSSLRVVSLTRKSPSTVNSLTTSSLGKTPWNHSSSTKDLLMVSDTYN